MVKLTSYLCVTGVGRYVNDDVDRKEFTLLGIVKTQVGPLITKSFINNMSEFKIPYYKIK